MYFAYNNMIQPNRVFVNKKSNNYALNYAKKETSRKKQLPFFDKLNFI